MIETVIRIQNSLYLLLSNRPKRFHNSFVIETGLQDFHNVAVIVMRTTFEKLKPIGT